MLMVLLSGLTASSSLSGGIRAQYDNKQLKLAVQSGVAMMNMCMAKSYNLATWTAAKPLKPNTDCKGDPVSGAAQYVLDTSTLKTSFEVGEVTFENGAQRTSVIGKLDRYRSSSSTPVAATVTDTRNIVIGAQSGFSNVTFGYCASCGAGDGAQLAVVLATGEVKALGQNDNGRLGVGAIGSSPTQRTVVLPGGERGAAAFSNFLSIGRQLSILTVSGKVYSAGSNEYGQLGNPASGTTNPISTPVQFGSYGNSGQPTATYAGMSNYATYVMASDNNIYSAGSCVNGVLGWGCSSGTSATPGRVNLPTPTSDTNTQPQNVSSSSSSADNMVIDRLNVYTRMKGGAVYGWGINDYGQLGTGNTTQANSPVRLQALSSTGSPYINATQLSFNGTAIYALDGSTGQVWAAGSNDQGEQLGAGVPIRNNSTGTCMRVDPSTYYLVMAACNGGGGGQFLEWWPDQTLRFRTNSGTFGPTDSMLCAHDSGAGAVVHMGTCGAYGPTANIYAHNSTGTITAASGCMNISGSNVIMSTSCGGTVNQWTPLNNPYMRPVPRPPYDSTLGRNPKYVKVTTDNRTTVLVDENGAAWAAGGNNRGQMGTGSARSLLQPMLKRVILPNGSKVVDAYVTETMPNILTDGANLASYNNAYFVLSDGSVYGAGANNHGQLGNKVALPGPDAVLTPVKMELPPGVLARSVQSGFGTTVVISTTGKVYTMGNNSNGQLGDNSVASSSEPKANAYTNQRGNVTY